MSTHLFTIKKHTITSQHVREYPGATAHEDEEFLELVVTQYNPLSNPCPQDGDLTIIGAHANGFPKEVYEPLWDDLLTFATERSMRIRGIWMADVAHQGESGVLNEFKLGNDPSWFDHSRDLLAMINHFRRDMPMPLFGIGHSMGACQLAHLSLMHPRLLTGLALVEPVIDESVGQARGAFTLAYVSAFRRDLWPSRQAAAESCRKSAFYQAWDSRVLDRWIECGLRDLPTAVHKDVNTGVVDLGGKYARPVPVTLTTTKLQEVRTFARPANTAPSRSSSYTASTPPTQPSSMPVPLLLSLAGVPVIATQPRSSQPLLGRSTHPDIIPSLPPTGLFYRPEPVMTFGQLAHLRPGVLYVFGDLSFISQPAQRAAKLRVTGVGVGGSGGVAEERVREVVVPGGDHFLPMKDVGAVAKHIGNWLILEVNTWQEHRRQAKAERNAIPLESRFVLDKEYLHQLRVDNAVKPKL